MNEFTLLGEWLSSYTHDDNQTTLHTVVFKPHLKGVIGESLPQSDLTRLTLHLQYDSDNNVLTGTWREISSLTKQHNGEIFHGALQLIPNTSGSSAEGLWVGYNEDRSKINSGKWSLTKKPPMSKV